MLHSVIGTNSFESAIDLWPPVRGERTPASI
jgi:hypothetical protein